nr:transcription factor MYB35 [Tanacetum cinerariifolium]
MSSDSSITTKEDAKILTYVASHGIGNWTLVPQKADNAIFIDDNNNNPDAVATYSITSQEAVDKSVETSKIISEQVDEVTDTHLETNITLPEEAESRIEKSVATNVDKSKEANITAMEQSDVETGFIAHEPNKVEPPHGIPKTENADEPNKQEEIVRKISAIKGADVSSEVTGEEGKPSIQVSDDTSKMVGNKCNTDASEHQADIKE